MDVLEAERVPDAGDVNALDEVPRSSFWGPPSSLSSRFIAKRPGSSGPPEPPFTVLADAANAGRGGFRIADSRGQRYELRVDPADRPGMRTAASAIGSRLAWAFGYPTPEVFITTVAATDFIVDERSLRADGSPVDFESVLRSGPEAANGRYRVSATHWPLGIEVGPAPIATTRDDDPNDLIPHRDRRTLRALHVFGNFLGLRTIGPHSIADIYVGPEGEGHLQHFLVGLDDALGAADVVRESDPDIKSPLPPLESLLTLGLAPSQKRPLTQTTWLSIGEFSADLDPKLFSPPDPYEPIERILPADGYWAAKRLARLSRRVLVAAVRAADLDDPVAGAQLVDTLDARRRILMAHWYSQVSPLELLGMRRGDLLVIDRAIADGVTKASGSMYAIDFLDEEGEKIADSQKWRASGSRFRVAMPEAVREKDYWVVRIVAERGGKPSPRAFEVHGVSGEGMGRVVGVRH